MPDKDELGERLGGPGWAIRTERRLEAVGKTIAAMARRGEFKLRCGQGGCPARPTGSQPGLYGCDCPQYTACMAELRALLALGAVHG